MAVAEYVSERVFDGVRPLTVVYLCGSHRRWAYRFCVDAKRVTSNWCLNPNESHWIVPGTWGED